MLTEMMTKLLKQLIYKLFSHTRLEPLTSLLITLTFIFLISTPAQSGLGDFAVYRDTTGVDAIGTSVTDVSWDTSVSDTTSTFTFTPGNTDISLEEAGHYLIMYSIPTVTSGGTNRSEMQSWIRNVTQASNYQYGRGQGYIRRSGGTDEGYNQGAAIIDVSAGDNIRIQMQRTDSNSATVQRRADKSGHD